MLKFLIIIFLIFEISIASIIRNSKSPRDDPDISCTYKEPTTSARYTCILTINNPNGLNNFTKIDGNHIDDYTDADVLDVFISYQNTRNIPSIICQQFPNLLDLLIGMSQVQILDRDSFDGCWNLSFLIVSSNFIRTIPSDIFISNPNLLVVMFPDNHIQQIGQDIFRGTNVTFVDFDDNELDEYHPGWFNGIEDILEVLIISFNRFPQFPAFGFEPLKNLKELDISMNPIVSLYQHTFIGLSNLTKLYLSRIGMSIVNPVWFRPLENIEEIYLSYNMIRELPDDTFQGLHKLLTVNLNNNDLTFVGASSFGDSIRNIRYLMLTYNNILAIDSELIDTAENLIWLLLNENECYNMNFYNVPDQREEIANQLQYCFTNFIGTAKCQYIDILNYPYECLLYITNPVGNDFEELSGEHISGRNNSDVLIVEALYQHTRNVPNVICRQFPNVELIWIEESHIEIINESSFLNCARIESIVLSYNRIARIPDNIFSTNPNLLTFEASHNIINQIGQNAFSGTGLELVNLENNRLLVFVPQLYESLADTLQELYLAENNFTTLPSGAFDRLINLEKLDLSRNIFNTLPSNSFRYLRHLRELFLRSCGLDELNVSWFEDLQSLERILLDHNRIRAIPDGIFKSTKFLNTLSINDNLVRNIHGTSFGNLSSFSYLFASRNGIRAIDRNFFDAATNIFSIYLEENICSMQNFINIKSNREAVRNSLTECFQMFDGFINCSYYETPTYMCRMSIQNVQGRNDFTEIHGEHHENRSNNDVKFVEIDSQDTQNLPSVICKQFPNLIDLYVLHSFVQVIDEDAFEHCHNLEYLRLNRNEITLIPDFTFINTPKLSSIELYKNRISNIEPNAFSQLQLEMIDLEDNMLTTIDNRWFESSSGTLKYVYMSYNNLRTISVNAFQHFGNVVFFDLGVNPGIELPSNVFRPMVTLSALFLDHCEIEEINTMWLRGLPELTQVIFRSNQIRNLQAGVFDTTHLRHIDVGDNRIPIIHADMFGSSIGDLQYFINDDNPTNSIDPQFFDESHRIVNLFLGRNLCFNGNLYNIFQNRETARQQLEPCFNNFERRIPLRCDIYNEIICFLTIENPSGHDDFEEIDSNLEIPNHDIILLNAVNQNTRIVPKILCDRFTNLISMVLVSSGIERLTENSFENCRNLETLEIYFNPLSTIEAGTFRNAERLSFLDIEGNRVHSIADGAFAGAPVSHLFLGMNSIEQFNRNMLNGIQDTLEELYLFQNTIRELPENSFEGLDNLKVLDIGYNPGIHLPSNIFRTLNNLNMLYIDTNELIDLNPEWFTSLSNLDELDIYKNNIRSLPNGIFVELKSLTRIMMHNNPIEVLNADAFGENIRNLVYLNAASCQIEAFDEKLIDNTDNLNILYLYDNVCLSANFIDIVNNRENVKEQLETCINNFRGFVECHYYRNALNEYNCIFEVSNIAGHDQFTTIPGEHDPTMSDDDIVMVQAMYQVTKNIPRVICSQFQNIKEIFVEDSRLEFITIENCLLLERLILAYNQISFIDSGTFRNNPHLQFLDVHNNQILSIADDAFIGSRLMHLNLGINPLRAFHPSWIASISSTLKNLLLYETQIEIVPENAFDNLTKLEYLDIGINHNIHIPKNAFNKLVNLQSLFLDSSGLRNVDPQWFQNLEELQDLHLHSNRLRELPVGAFINLSLLYLSVRNNRLTSVNSNSFGHSLTTIESFYATNNRINAIERSFFEQALNMDTLYLFNNFCVDQNFREVVSSRNFVSGELQKCFENFENDFNLM